MAQIISQRYGVVVVAAVLVALVTDGAELAFTITTFVDVATESTATGLEDATPPEVTPPWEVSPPELVEVATATLLAGASTITVRVLVAVPKELVAT
jgi:hypothetical protein